MILWGYQLDQDLAFAPLLFESSELHFRLNEAEPQLNVVFIKWQFAIPCILDCSFVIFQILLVVIYRHGWWWRRPEGRRVDRKPYLDWAKMLDPFLTCDFRLKGLVKVLTNSVDFRLMA